MKKKFRHLIIAAIAMLMICSCEKDESQAIEKTISKEAFIAPTITNAQTYFNQNYVRSNSLTGRTTSVTSHVAWDKSKARNYKQTDTLDVDILYTPMYLNTQFNAKAFIATTEHDGIVDGRKVYVLYKSNDISSGLSAYIIVYNLDGTFDEAYNYLNGTKIPFPQPTSNTFSRTTDCNDAHVDEMTDEEFEEFLANCYSPLGEVTVVATIDAGPSGGGGAPTTNPFDAPNGWVDVSGILGYDQPQTGGSTTNGNNPNVFVPNVVTANATSIAIALNLSFGSIEFNWLQQQQINNQSILEAIAAYLNANKVRPPNQSVFENADPMQFPVINTEAIGFVIGFINDAMSSGVDILSEYYVEEPDNPINDIEEHLECFIPTQSAQITIFVDQPIANNDTPFVVGQEKAGHAFIGISQNGITRHIGLYPNGNATPANPNHPHVFDDNSGDSYDISLTFSVDPASLQLILGDAINYPNNYDLNDNNCTDYVINVANLAGISLPDPQSIWLGGGGSNPGAFGEAIRQMDLPEGMTRNNNGGNAPDNSGFCN